MRRALGKGLAQLLGEQSDVQPNELEIGQIVPNKDQPRKHFDEDALDELAESIRAVGLLQPIVVRPIAEHKYEIIAGERRYRAAQRAGLTSVPISVRSASDASVLQLALIENVQREDISPVECALAYRQLVDEFNLTQEQVAQRVGKSRVAVSNTLRLLKLPDEVLEALGAGLITEGHAKALLSCPNERKLKELFFRIIDQGLTVREAEKAARSVERATPSPKKKPQSLDADWRALETAFGDYFGSPAKLQKDGKGGRIQISFYSDDDLQRILDLLDISL
ncbi:MAG: ParB/RepB/Spo0J family partition protein [Fimbriimonadaceae bacterium]|nr:ParB/RepB/Spo0J family partition protein [Fimbriimonadaceae bacterium]